MTVRVFSYGGGVQSTACLVLAAEGKIDYPTFLFALTGDDSEHPDTLTYLDDVAKPYAAEHGIDLIVVQRQLRDGSVAPSLLQSLLASKRSIDIPVRLDNAAPGNRRCTADYKIRPIARWLREHGATKTDPAVTGLGISVDEMQRARTDSGIAYQRLAYPLLDLMQTRDDCRRIIADGGLPVPPKSACYFCPYSRRDHWRVLHRDHPDLFTTSVELERTLHERGEKLGRRGVALSPFGVPLDQAISDNVQLDFGADGGDDCESGFCMT